MPSSLFKDRLQLFFFSVWSVRILEENRWFNDAEKTLINSFYKGMQRI